MGLPTFQVNIITKFSCAFGVQRLPRWRENVAPAVSSMLAIAWGSGRLSAEGGSEASLYILIILAPLPLTYPVFERRSIMRRTFFLEREALVGDRKFFLPTLEVAATRLEWYIPRLAHTFSCIEAKSLSRQMNSIHVPFPPCLWHGCSVSLFLFEFYFII